MPRVIASVAKELHQVQDWPLELVVAQSRTLPLPLAAARLGGMPGSAACWRRMPPEALCWPLRVCSAARILGCGPRKTQQHVALGYTGEDDSTKMGWR